MRYSTSRGDSRTLARGLAALVLSACAVEPLGSVTEPIISGARETGRREVVAVVRDGEAGGLCTGTVIGPFAVLTAKHCVFDEAERPIPAALLFVLVADNVLEASGIERIVPVMEVRTTPGSRIDDDIENGNDIAVLLLRENIDVPPMAPSRRRPAEGEGAFLVGFGRTRPGRPLESDAGLKFSGAAEVGRVGARLMETIGSSWTCQGDSGGPAFSDANEVLAITSFGVDLACTTSNSFYTRVDVHLALIDDALAFVPPCEPETERCDGVDNDCNGETDEGCLGLGEVCTDPIDCSDMLCEDVGGSNICVRACDPRETIARCPEFFHCEVTGCGTGRCVPGEPGGLANGAECTTDIECASSFCGTGSPRRCGRSCSPGGIACPTGELCEADGECGQCIPVTLSTRPRPFGSPCDASAQCESGTCSDGICTQACGAECPFGYHCRAGLCAFGPLGELGSDCVTAEDCSPSAPECVDAEGELLCSRPCDAANACPERFECTDVGGVTRCVPPGMPLGAACVSSAECRSRLCGGLCTRVCSPSAPCPNGFECVDAGGAMGCAPAAGPGPTGPVDRGGCSASAESWQASLALVAMGALFFARRRKRT
jgi:hypothetical protein